MSYYKTKVEAEANVSAGQLVVQIGRHYLVTGKDNAKRIEGENLQVRRLIRLLLKKGFSVSVDNGEEETEFMQDFTDIFLGARSTDRDVFRVIHPTVGQSWVLLVYGNGDEVISDYGTRLDKLMSELGA